MKTASAGATTEHAPLQRPLGRELVLGAGELSQVDDLSVEPSKRGLKSQDCTRPGLHLRVVRPADSDFKLLISGGDGPGFLVAQKDQMKDGHR